MSPSSAPTSSRQVPRHLLWHPFLRVMAPGRYPAGGRYRPVMSHQPRTGISGLCGRSAGLSRATGGRHRWEVEADRTSVARMEHPDAFDTSASRPTSTSSPSNPAGLDLRLLAQDQHTRIPQTVAAPVKLAAFHRRALEGKTINTSVTLNKQGDGWWLDALVRRGGSHPERAVCPSGRRGCGHRQLRHDERRPTLWHVSWQAPRTSPACPGEAAASRPNCASAWRRKASRAPGGASPGMCARRSTARSTSALPSAREAQLAYEQLSVAKHEVQGARHECVSCTPPTWRISLSRSPGLAAKSGRAGNESQERLHLAGVQRVSLSRSRQPTQPANVLLHGLWLQRTCRSQRIDQHRTPPGS